MTNVLRRKYLTCFEWTVTVESVISRDYMSEKFKLQDQMCNLTISYRHGICCLYFESGKKLKHSEEVILDVVTSHQTNHDTYKPLKLRFIGSRQEIWSCFVGLQNHPLIYKITIYRNYSKENPKGAMPHNSESQERELSHVAKDSHFQALSEDIFKLLGDTSNCDVRITCDGKTFHAHKNVLGARSPVLSAMLKSNMVEGETGLVNVEDVENSTFECFLHYLYSGKLPKLTLENAVALYRVGDKYAVEKLKLTCSEFMTQNLSENKACDMLVLADLHSDKDFREKVISYIIDRRLPQRDKKWSDFCKCHSNLANEVFALYIEKHCPM